MHQEYIDNSEWVEALRQAVHNEEDLQDWKKLKENYSFGSNSSGKRKQDEPTTATCKIMKKVKYTGKEQRVY